MMELLNRKEYAFSMSMQHRVTKLFTELFHHIPDLELKEDAREYALLQAALRDIVRDCKKIAEQHASGGPEGPWGEGLRHGANRIAFAIERDVGK